MKLLILFFYLTVIFYTKESLAQAKPKANSKASDCVICILMTPGQKTLEELVVFEGSIAAALEKLSSREQKLRAYRVAYADLKRQQETLRNKCSADKESREKNRGLFTKSDKSPVATCTSYIETSSNEIQLELIINQISQDIVQKNLTEARTKEKQISYDTSRGIYKNANELNKISKIVTTLKNEQEKLNKEDKRLNEPIKDATGKISETQQSFLVSIGLVGTYLPHCFAKMDEDTMQLVECGKYAKK